MSIKRLALCRSQGRLFVLLRFAGQDVAALIEREGSQAFAHATTSGSCVPSLVLPVDHGRVLALCPSVSDYERELAVLVLPFLDGSSMDVVFASGGQRLGSIRLDSRVAKLESKINYKAKPALCALVRDAQRGECCGRYEIDAVRYLPADAGAVWRYRRLPAVAQWMTAMPADASPKLLWKNLTCFGVGAPRRIVQTGAMPSVRIDAVVPWVMTRPWSMTTMWSSGRSWDSRPARVFSSSSRRL